MLLEDTKGSRWKWKGKRGGMGGSRKGYRGSVIARRRLRFRDRANREWFSPELFHSSQFPDQRRIRSALGRRTWSSIRVLLFFPSSHRRLYTNNRYERVHRCRLLFFPSFRSFLPIAYSRRRLSSSPTQRRQRNGQKYYRRKAWHLFPFSLWIFFISFVFEILFLSLSAYFVVGVYSLLHLLSLSLPGRETSPLNSCVRSIRAHGVDISCGRSSGVGWTNLGERKGANIIKC